MKKIIGNPNKTNQEIINLIKKTKINNYFLKNKIQIFKILILNTFSNCLDNA